MSASKLFFVLLIFFVFAAPVFVLKGHASSEDVAASAISQAEEVLASAYEAVLEAEKVGADVSGLLPRLNVAGEDLANAHIWYGLGDFDNATRFANICYDVGEEVKDEAYVLKNEAHSPWVSSLVVRMTGSLIAVIIIVSLSFLAWRAFKRRYRKRVLGMKPEVVSGES